MDVEAENRNLEHGQGQAGAVMRSSGTFGETEGCSVGEVLSLQRYVPTPVRYLLHFPTASQWYVHKHCYCCAARLLQS